MFGEEIWRICDRFDSSGCTDALIMTKHFYLVYTTKQVVIWSTGATVLTQNNLASLDSLFLAIKTLGCDLS